MADPARMTCVCHQTYGGIHHSDCEVYHALGRLAEAERLLDEWCPDEIRGIDLPLVVKTTAFLEREIKADSANKLFAAPSSLPCKCGELECAMTAADGLDAKHYCVRATNSATGQESGSHG